MEKIEINHFKAFGGRIVLSASNLRKNILVFGENGSGKSSLYEAIKLVFFHQRFAGKEMPKGASEEAKQASLVTFNRKFNHKQPQGTAETPFTIRFNNADYLAFDTSAYQCFMLDGSCLDYESYINQNEKIIKKDVVNLKQLFSSVVFPDVDIERFLNQNSNLLISKVNTALKNDYIEECKITIENSNLDICIEQGNLKESNGLHLVFNEAKINLVVILLFLESILLLKTNDIHRRKILVLDDLITSLDACNRLFFSNYLLNKFGDFQIICFTHNVGFNNLFFDRVKENNAKEKWLFYNLYLTNRGPQMYNYDELTSAVDIRNEFNSGFLTPANVGYEIRKRFEADILEIAKLFQIDATSRAMDIISDITQQNGLFYFKKLQGKLLDSNDLVGEIKKIVESADSDNVKVSKIVSEIRSFHSDSDVVKLSQFISEFHYYERLFIHSLAHGVSPMPTYFATEVEAATRLLEKIEKIITSIKSNLTMP